MQPGSTNHDRVHLVVLGASVAGTLAARGFAEAGTDVMLVGAARGPDLGLVHCGLAETPARLRDALGTTRFAELTAFARRSPGLLGAPRVEGVWAAVGPGEDALMAPSARALSEIGIAARVADGQELEARGVRAACGLVVPGEALVDPVPALAAERDAAQRAGARLIDRDPTGLRVTADGLVVEVDGASVHAEMVVLADGALAARFVPWFAELFVPVREQALVVAGTIAPVVGRAGHGYTWFRPWREGVAVGGSRWATAHLEVGETVVEIVPEIQHRLEAFARDRLGHPEVVDRWAWIDAHTCDGLPIVGPVPGEPRIVVCAGFVGNEWGLGPAAARAVVDGILGGPTPTPTMFSPSRFVG